jgi:PAS domain S-box-containing protein
METRDIVTSIAEAAYATDGKCHIVAWNAAAERLMGYDPSQVLGRPCHEIMGGRDLFGNRFCSENCALVNMARRHEAVHDFELYLRTAESEIVRADVSAMVAPARAPLKFVIIHTLRHVGPDRALEETPRDRADAGKPPAMLTRREIEVLRLLADGRSSGMIADLLSISLETVRNHIKHILRKLGVHSRIEALALARRNRLL